MYNIVKSIEKVHQAIEDIKNGKMIIVGDDESRENEGDIVCAAEHIDAIKMNFIISHAKGLVCAPMSYEHIERLDLGQMVQRNTDHYGTKFTVSIDSDSVRTGISAKERAKTLLDLCNLSKNKDNFKRPGHIFPLLSEKNGILQRRGHTEVCVDLLRMANKKEIGVICEIIGEDGEMLKGDELSVFGKKHQLTHICIQDVLIYRLSKETIFIKKAILPMATNQSITHYKGISHRDYYVYHSQGEGPLDIHIGDIHQLDTTLFQKLTPFLGIFSNDTQDIYKDYYGASLCLNLLKEMNTPDFHIINPNQGSSILKGFLSIGD